MKLIITYATKLPGPTDYSSVQAGISIEKEVPETADLQAESAVLYRQAEEAVSRQLASTGLRSGQTADPAPSREGESWAGAASSRPTRHPAMERAGAIRTGRPLPGNGRRSLPPATSSQLGLIRRLLGRDGGLRDRILDEQGVSALESLTVRQASQVIDALKAEVQP